MELNGHIELLSGPVQGGKTTCLAEPVDLLVLDEVGPMELEGLGWSEILDSLEQQTNTRQLWVVRQEIVSEACRRWNIPDHVVSSTNHVNISF